MPASMDQLGQLMNPLQPQARNPPVPNATMVAPQAPPQPQPAAPQQPPMPPPAAGAPPPGIPPQGMPPVGMPPQGMQPGQPNPMMPRPMPDIVQMLMSRIMQQGGPQGPAQGTQSTPLTGQPPTVGGQ
jgi:hypothetical protein